MDASVDDNLRKEALHLYFIEVKDTQQEAELEEEEVEHVLLNEVEQATDFLNTAGLSNLSKLYHEGKEISEVLVNDSVRQRHLTEKQAQTIRSRVRTLNNTLRGRQPRRKRQDVRDVAWNVETSSTGSRSRSATPDSLDSNTPVRELPSDDEQPSLVPDFLPDNSGTVLKGKLKWTSSEPLYNKLSRSDRGDVAHLGSENVILKAYQPLGEYGTLTRPQRERSGSDPTTEVHLSRSGSLSRSHNCLSELLSFEGIMKQNVEDESNSWDFKDETVNIDELSDSEYQHLKPLVYVELTAIFDQYKIAVLKRKSKSKRKKGNVFGVILATLVMRDMPRPTDNSMIPKIYQNVINNLNKRCLTEDGILRVAGQKQKLEQLCREIEEKFYTNPVHVESILSQATVHELTGVLKKLLRDLPDPLFTMELFDMFYKCSKIPVKDDKMKALNLLVLMLPIEHRNTFRLLLQFFINVIQHEKQNRMSLHNVAMITAPSFFPPRLLLSNKASAKLPAKEDLEKQINDAAICCSLMECMLQSGERLWMVPSDLAIQARTAQRKAQDRKDPSKDKKSRGAKKKLVRSSTQYEPGAMVSPRMKRNFFV